LLLKGKCDKHFILKKLYRIFSPRICADLYSDDDEIGRIRSAIQKEMFANQSKKKILGDVVKKRVKSGNLTGGASQYGAMTSRTGGTASRGFTSGFSSTGSGGALVRLMAKYCLISLL